jgi:uncharacterized surface protein with fasciclin (FAS1) repeats
MKKVLYVATAAAVFVFASCGNNADKEAERKKREADSLAKLEKARQDSLANAQANAVKNITETAAANADFSTLVSLLEKAELATVLKDSTKNFTVFAPTNAAFEKFDQKVLADLQKPENKEKLKEVLLYHVVDGKKMDVDVVAATELVSLNGKKIAVGKNEAGGATVADAAIITANIDCSNGVIHSIDAVMVEKMGKGSSNKGNKGGKGGKETTNKTDNKTDGKVDARTGGGSQKIDGRGATNKTEAQKIDGRGGK